MPPDGRAFPVHGIGNSILTCSIGHAIQRCLELFFWCTEWLHRAVPFGLNRIHSSKSDEHSTRFLSIENPSRRCLPGRTSRIAATSVHEIHLNQPDMIRTTPHRFALRRMSFPTERTHIGRHSAGVLPVAGISLSNCSASSRKMISPSSDDSCSRHQMAARSMYLLAFCGSFRFQ